MNCMGLIANIYLALLMQEVYLSEAKDKAIAIYGN